MKTYGLIGKSLTHSFSKDYFEKKFALLGINDCQYQNFEIESISQFPELISGHPSLRGLNVTIPYKEIIIPYITEMNAEAREIGAVNCIWVGNGKLIGYNTDVYGFSQSIKPFLDHHHQRALVLGSGGASKAVVYSLSKLGVDVYTVTSRQKTHDKMFHYNELNSIIMDAFKLVVNCTPLGTLPDLNTCPALPYEHFTPQHLAYDLVYNPPQTTFLKKAAEKGALTVNGLSMLQLQADKSWEIWNS